MRNKRGRNTKSTAACVLSLIQGDTSRCAKPPVDFETKVPLWPGKARPGQNRTSVLESTGGFAQRDLSPCTFVLWRQTVKREMQG